MSWYAGTAKVRNGSKTVAVVAGGGLVANSVLGGNGFLPVSGSVLEIDTVDGPNQLTLKRAWLGADSDALDFSVVPTNGAYLDLAAAAVKMLQPFQAVIDGIGQGLIPAGTAAAPGLRFLIDHDTGLRRTGENAMALTAGGIDALEVKSDGSVGVPRNFSGNVAFGATAFPTNVSVTSANQTSFQLESTVANSSDTVFRYRSLERVWDVGLNSLGYNGGCYQITDRTVNVERLRIDTGGNLLVGRPDGFGLNVHTIAKGTAQGDRVCNITGNNAGSVMFFSAASNSYSQSAAATGINANSATGRSINAAGTINASGADYAEYMAKAGGCGPIAKGDVCGVDRNGKLTRTWAQALSFMVKSTDPNLVGGDAWSQHLGPRPEDPGEAPVAPVMPTAPSFEGLALPVREADEDDDAFLGRLVVHVVVLRDAEAANATYEQALTAFQERSAAYPTELEEFTARRDAYDRNLPVWEAELEAARATVDRIAYCGQTPVNVDADTLAACGSALDDGVAAYLVAIANGGGIGVKAVREADMTIGDYMRRIGKVLRIEAGRPVVDVQHG